MSLEPFAHPAIKTVHWPATRVLSHARLTVHWPAKQQNAHMNKAQMLTLSPFVLYLTVWGAEPIVTHQKSRLEAQVYVVCHKTKLVGVHRESVSAGPSSPSLLSHTVLLVKPR